MRVFLFTVKYIIFFMICFITLMSFCLSFVSGVSFFLEEEKIIFGQRLLISCAVAIVSFLMAYAIDKYIKISLDDRDMYLIHSGITGITGVILLFPFFKTCQTFPFSLFNPFGGG